MKFQTSNKESTAFERPHIDEGLHNAEFLGTKEMADGQYGSRCIFLFNTEKDNVELALVVYTVNDASPNNKLGQTLIALGAELGEEVDADSLKGAKCRVLVEDYTYEEDNNGSMESKTASSISKVKPLA